MKYRNIEITKSDDEFCHTKGLITYIGHELCLKRFGNDQGELALIYFIVDYILNESAVIASNETISYGLWLLKFVEIGDYFKIYELDEQF